MERVDLERMPSALQDSVAVLPATGKHHHLQLLLVISELTSYSGTTDEYCQAGCLSDYGTCKGISITDSWRKAQKYGKTDEEGGGQYYFDSQNNIFWTWDTPELIARKFEEIVEAKKLGGVMAWSLGEDTYNFEHLEAIQKGLESQASNAV